MSDSELQQHLHSSKALAEVCRKHGEVDGEKAHEATARACERELAERGLAAGRV